MNLTIATWNINTIRKDLILNGLGQNGIDVVCLQKTKVTDHQFPTIDFTDIGYTPFYKRQKTYNGVCIFSRSDITDVKKISLEL